MQTIFCTECGHKMVYSGSKPKFCSSCGTPIGSSAKKETEPSTPKKADPKTLNIREQMEAKRKKPHLNDDETDIDYIPNIASFQCDFTSSGNPTYKFGEILGDAKEEPEQVKPERQQRRKK